MRGLIVTATVTTPVVAGVARQNLASLLAWASAGHQVLPSMQETGPVPVPIPLARLWTDEYGKPLWAATDIYPISDVIEGREYLHKRYPSQRANLGRKMKINTAAGQFKERRKPIKTIVAREWRAALIMDNDCEPDDIQQLLDDVRSIGPHGAAGYGAVHEWRVELADIDPAFIVERRNVPARAQLATGTAAPLRPWCPPYWYSPWWEDCVEGQPCF